MIDRAELAEFLRQRRESLQPEDVGLPRGRRRRTRGLRREEVAVLCHMSTDYYARLEQERGPHPTRRGPDSRAAHYATLLLAESEEFTTLWHTHEVGVRPQEVKRFLHPEVGTMDLNCQTLLDPEQAHLLLVYTATPGTESYEKLQLLSVVSTEMHR